MVIGDPAPDGIGYNVDAVVGIDANPQDKWRSWKSLRYSIRRGANQLVSGPSGIVAVHYADPVPDFETLRPSSKPMLEEVARLMEQYQYLKAVILSSEPDLQLPHSMGPGNVRAYVNESWWAAGLLGEPVQSHTETV
jgi:hypothetical protein